MSLPLSLFTVQGQSQLTRRKLEALSGSEIAGLVAALPSAKQRARYQIVLRRAQDATIERVEVKRRFAEIVIGFTRSVRLMGGVVEVPTKYRIWIRRNASLLAVAGTAPTLAEAFATSVQWSIAGDKVNMNKLEVTVPFLHRLERWLDSEMHSRPGAMIRARFVDAVLDQDEPFDEITLARRHTLLDSSVYKALSEGAGKPVYMTFLTPLFEGISRQLLCSISFRGMLRILGTNTSPEEANYLLDEVETLIG